MPLGYRTEYTIKAENLLGCNRWGFCHMTRGFLEACWETLTCFDCAPIGLLNKNLGEQAKRTGFCRLRLMLTNVINVFASTWHTRSPGGSLQVSCGQVVLSSRVCAPEQRWDDRRHWTWDARGLRAAMQGEFHSRCMRYPVRRVWPCGLIPGTSCHMCLSSRMRKLEEVLTVMLFKYLNSARIRAIHCFFV